jgi:3-oxoacyl-[acyl-carrier protein] reductase
VTPGSRTPLARKVAIVTDSGRGLGRAVALRLASDGPRLLLVDIDPVTAADTAGEVGRSGGAAKAVTEDVADGPLAGEWSRRR